MNKPVQVIVSPAGERLVVIPEGDYQLLLTAFEDDEGEVMPSYLEELRRRRQNVAKGDVVERISHLKQ